MVHAAGAPQPGVLVVEHRLCERRFVFAESHIARRLRRMARRARMRPILTIALTVRPASASAAAITINSFCSDAVGFAVTASAAAGTT